MFNVTRQTIVSITRLTNFFLLFFQKSLLSIELPRCLFNFFLLFNRIIKNTLYLYYKQFLLFGLRFFTSRNSHFSAPSSILAFASKFDVLIQVSQLTGKNSQFQFFFNYLLLPIVVYHIGVSISNQILVETSYTIYILDLKLHTHN